MTDVDHLDELAAAISSSSRHIRAYAIAQAAATQAQEQAIRALEQRVGALEDTPPQPPPSPLPTLRWPRPALTNPVRIVIPERGQPAGIDLKNLDASTDYELVFATGLRLEPLNIWGGRTVTLVGGEQRIDTNTSSYYGDHRLMELRYMSMFHLEGYWGHGDGLGEGINVWMPGGILQIQNTRIDDCRQQAVIPNNHADVIQWWSGPAETRIWQFTSAGGDWQGLYPNYAHGYKGPRGDDPQLPGHVILERVNLTPRKRPDWNGRGADYTPLCFIQSPRTRFDLTDVWLETGWWNDTVHKGLKDSLGLRCNLGDCGSPVGTLPLWAWQEHRADGTAYGPEHVGQPANGVYSDMQSKTDAQPGNGDYIRFTRPAEDNIHGIVTQGVPPGGDFVPADTVGRDYR